MSNAATADHTPPFVAVSTTTEVIRGAVPVIKNVHHLTGAKVVTATAGAKVFRCWVLPGTPDEPAVLSHGASDLIPMTPNSVTAVSLSDLDTDSVSVVRAPASRMNRAWWIGPRRRPTAWRVWQRPVRSVLSIDDRWLIVESWSPPCDGDVIELNRFQMDLLGIDVGATVQCSALGDPPVATRTDESPRPVRWLRTGWRRWATMWEAVMRTLLGAPEMSMVVTLGTQGDDRQTVRVDPAILPFLGAIEGDVLVIRGTSGRALVTAVARGVPNDFVEPQIVPIHPCRQLRQIDQQLGIVPSLQISVPAPVREDIGEFCGAIVRVRRRVMRVVGRNALALATPIVTGVVALAATTNSPQTVTSITETTATATSTPIGWGDLAVPIAVAAVTLFFVLRSLRHKAPPSGRWP